MRSIPATIALMMLAWIISSTAALFSTGSSPPNVAQGELRCEGAGAIVINIDGADYAINGMASRRYPSIQLSLIHI